MPERPRNNRTPDGAKRRWSADDRARRSDGPPAARRSASAAPSEGSRPARRDARFGSSSGSAEGRHDRRTDWYPGPRTGRPQGGDDRGASRDERPRRFDDRGDRPRRSEERGDRPARSDDRGDRPRRFEDRGARPARADDRGDRPRRFEERGDRPARSDDRGDRPRRFEDRGERPARFDDRADRSRSDDRGGRPARAGERTEGFRRVEDRADRPRRTDDRGQRPHRSDDRDRPRRFEDRPTGRPQRADDRSDRPRRSDDRTDRPRRVEDRQDRPQRQERAGALRGGAGRDERRPRTGRDDRPAHYETPEDVVLERLEGEVVTAEEVQGIGFADLGLGQQVVRALGELGATEPFPIQAATIPAAVAGRNVLGRGRTGSGKTIAFGAALVERLMRTWAESGRTGTGRRMGRPPRALILAPTRELALQIDRTVQPIARSVGLFTTQIVGGVPQGRQVGALGKGVDIVIGTPGRMEDLLEQGRLDLGSVEITVLDEADHMADLGFLEPIQRLLRRVPAEGQRLMFSATLDTAVSRLVDEFLPDPDVHEVADAEGAGTADHRVLVVEPGQKLEVLAALLSSVERSLVFARTRAFAEQLADDLDDAGVRAESLHGDLNQARRTRNLARFSEGRVSTLVATDVAARGIHVDGIELVVHADAAEDYKTYLHRSGRTGRAGASGRIVTLINPRRRRRMTELLERAGVTAGFAVLRPGDDPVAAVRPPDAAPASAG